MKKHLIAFAVAAIAVGCAFAQTNDTMAKVKASGVITMGAMGSTVAFTMTFASASLRTWKRPPARSWK